MGRIHSNIHNAVLDEKNRHIQRLENAIKSLVSGISTERILSHIRNNTSGEELLETENAALRARVTRLEEAGKKYLINLPTKTIKNKQFCPS